MPLVRDNVVPWPEVMPLDKQSVPVPGTKRPGQTAHYRNGIWGLIDENTPNAPTTLDRIFNTGLKVGKDNPFLGHRPIVCSHPLKFANSYTWITYGEVDLRRRYLGSGLHTLFSRGELGGGDFETVGIWSINRPEWQIVDISLQSYRKVSVSLYDTLGNDSVEYVINHSHLTVIFCSSDHVPTLIKLAPKVPHLKMIICMDTVSVESARLLREWSGTQGVKFMELLEFEQFGKANLLEPIPTSPDDVASICYTSGTTSNPKGAILLHKSLALATFSNLHGLALPAEAITFSYLPLAHIYGRILELCTIAIGGRLGFFSGDPLRLLEDAQILKPDYFPSVPRVLNRIFQAAMAAGNVPGLKGKIFNTAVQTKLDRLHATANFTHPLWDRIVFRKVQAALGGRIQLMSTGSAPISREVVEFLRIAFACEFIEGTAFNELKAYGMTENGATCAKTWSEDGGCSGTVGPPQPVNEIKLIDVTTMGYTSEDQPHPRGELCVRGANCLVKYYKDEKNTRETIDSEGWLHTGDVAEIDSVGRFKIIDRVKNIMKLSQGEYVALEKIENLYSSSAVVAQIFVYGDSLQSYLVAVLVPDPVQLAEAVSGVTGKRTMPEDLIELERGCRDLRVVEHLLAVLTRDAKRTGLKGFEMVKRLHVCMKPFSVEDDTLTPTLKIRRKEAYAAFKREIDAMYSLGEP